MATEIALFTRDLRVHDNPQLAAACRADVTVPLFVLDDAMVAGPHRSANRLRFLCESLADLDASLRARGGALVIRRGDWVANVARVAASAGATRVHVADDYSRWAQRRLAHLDAALGEGVELVRHSSLTVVPPGAVEPGSGGEFKVFTPYYRRWLEVAWRAPAPLPKQITLPARIETVPLPAIAELTGNPCSPDLAPGGETAGRALLKRWAASRLARYGDLHDDLPGDGTSRISPYLHFGCLSAVEVAGRLRDRVGSEPFVRQLCWRDFYHQVVATFPDIARRDYRPRGDVWLDDDELFEAWAEGRTGYPVVDAGMRQLRREGWMHNRARMITASFLVKDLGIDWRRGAAHFLHWLCDGDIVQNSSNWQWTAGTGNDTRPNRVFNPLRQAERFDPTGAYVRRYVPELAAIAGAAVHQPWRLPADRRPAGYPAPLVDHDAAAAAFLARRTGGTTGTDPTVS